jgi:hypothetical protein
MFDFSFYVNSLTSDLSIYIRKGAILSHESPHFKDEFEHLRDVGFTLILGLSGLHAKLSD